MAIQNNKKLVKGVSMIEIAVIDAAGSTGAFVRTENVTDVIQTVNEDNQTPIIPDDKYSPIYIASTPGDADTIEFKMFDLSNELYAKMFNVEQDLTTSTTTVLSQRIQPTIAIRLTTEVVNGVKEVRTYPNTQASITQVNNFNKENLIQLQATCSLLPFTSVGGKDAIYTIQKVKADGAVINGTPPTVSAGSDTATSTATTALTGTASATSPKTIVSQQWTQVSGPNVAGFSTPNALTTNATGLVTGVYVFQLAVLDSDGIAKSATVKITATIA